MQEIFWIIKGLEGFLFMNKRPYLNSFFKFMPFMTLNVILFRKKKLKVLHTLALRFFVYLIPSLTNEWPRTKL